MIRHDWTLDEIRRLYDLPLLDLLFRAQELHRKYHPASQIQLCTLLSIKTGGCSEDCGYCSQSVHSKTAVEPTPLLDVDEVLQQARRAKEAGATRFCMGAAWRQARDGASFNQVLEMVRRVGALGLETCVTLGMLTAEQSSQLKAAGLTAYNHNLDTSPEYYGKIVTTHSYDDRLSTLEHVRQAGIQVCCGGIIGLGESIDDRCRLLAVLSSQNPHPESVPVNALVPVEGTPLANLPHIDPLELARMIAAARILMPRSLVRLSAGRSALSREAQTLCFLAGANSIFYGEKLLTTPNPTSNEDLELLASLGLKPMPKNNKD